MSKCHFNGCKNPPITHWKSLRVLVCADHYQRLDATYQRIINAHRRSWREVRTQQEDLPDDD